MKIKGGFGLTEKGFLLPEKRSDLLILLLCPQAFDMFIYVECNEVFVRLNLWLVYVFCIVRYAKCICCSTEHELCHLSFKL